MGHKSFIRKVNYSAMALNTSSYQEKREELISEEVMEIISFQPHWIIRRGNVIFLAVILLMLILTWFIQYPYRVKASARLLALNAPKIVVSKTEGKLDKLLVRNEQVVTTGQQLAWLQSTASHEQVQQLQDWIIRAEPIIKERGLSVLSANTLPDLSLLGELQPFYQDFQTILLETKQILSSGYYQKKREALQRDLQYLSALKNNTVQQKELLEQDQQLQKKEYDAYTSLAKDNVIAPLELNQYKSKLLAKSQSMQQADAQITNNEISSHNKRKELLDLQKFEMDQGQKFHSSLLNLKNEIDKWIQQYVVKAPESGKVFFINSLQENQLITTGQELFYVQSSQSQFYCELMASQNGFGKIKQGQKVLLRADGYPDAEFGYLTGKIIYISSLPNRKDSFLIKLNLPNGLITSYNKEVFFRNGLSAKAEIITDNRRLLGRLLGQLREVWNRN